MKEGWEYKKLGEVATIINGKNQKAVEDADGIYPICGSGGIMGYANEYLCPEQTVIIGRKGNINRPIYMEQKFWNVDTAFGIIADKSQLVPKYLYYFCVDFNFEKLNKAVTIPSLVKSDLLKIEMSIPPLSEQQQIVEELDLLSSIIEKKKAQLNELDNLAQSLFYEMFGDPITNEKGWEVKKLGDVCVFLQGEQVPVEEQSDIQLEGMVRFLRIIDFTQGNEPPRYVFCKDKKHILDSDEIAIVRYGSPGYVCYGKYGVIANNLFKIVARNKEQFVFRYFVSWLLSDAFQSVVNGNQYGAALKAIKFGIIKDIPFIQPPVALQQHFASKIEAIEHQKELIKQSIKEVETLFNSRMDYYFN